MSYITSPEPREKPRTISVYVEKRSDMKVHMFYCINCRNGVMKYQGEVVTVIPGDALNKFPLEILCRNINCQTTYNFIYWVTES